MALGGETIKGAEQQAPTALSRCQKVEILKRDRRKKERLNEMYIVNVNKQKAASERLSGRFKELHPI